MLSKTVSHACYTFWANAFGISTARLQSAQTVFVTSGRYIERVPGRFYAFFDALSGTRVFAAPAPQIAAFQATHPQAEIDGLDATSILTCRFLAQRALLYNDLDHYIPQQSCFTPMPPDFEIVTISREEQLKDFYAACSEDDVDTLDLELDTDTAIAGRIAGEIFGVASYRNPPESQIADITVLLRPERRGQGLSPPLVSALVAQIYEDALVPHYRAKVSNHKSLAIARRLGFQCTQQIIVWREDTPA